MRLSTCLFFAFLSACWSVPEEASAHPRGASASYVLTVHSEHGHELPTFHHDGQTFVMGRYGERYDIHVHNRTGRRVEAVVTVDGRDVVSGRVGDFVGERGYLIDAYDTVTISGFRQTTDAVAAFRFSSPSESYSSRMGTPQNVGIIGVAIFPERIHQPIVRPLRRPATPRRYEYEYDSYQGAPARDEASSERMRSKGGRGSAAPSASAPAEQKSMGGLDDGAASGSTDNLGTEYGESIENYVTQVAFERASQRNPSQVITLRYDDRKGLIARGVLVDPAPAPRAHGPRAFPQNRFAPPPPPYWD